jgi:predicted nucleic acid-binding protein
MTLAWFATDEQGIAALTVRDRILREGAVVPLIWRLEVANALLMMRRRGRLDEAEVASSVSHLAGLPIAADDAAWQQAWWSISELAAAERLTAYDAAYLELALRLSLPLATLDGALRRAAAARQVPIL